MIWVVRSMATVLFLISMCHGDSSPSVKSELSSISLMSAEAEDLSSIEMPVRRQRSGHAQNRPIVELFLGVLDTFHSSTKSELNRIKTRQARQNKAYEAAMAMISTTESPKMQIAPKLPTPRKRLVTARI